ncbi:hypothetical protein L4G92_02270 [Neisseria sp. ZJ106]|uniref:Periplasmic protein n=1 Tax=Neisseria lisongii TaxID=2912188 RepID=A0ABY7RJD9_9NEIS|nr:hypothetical protein [Neisseria lisongii]MCF7520878.1 hypothetical protein [Neisseria lisongii]WCL71313.1 hypothetical protein PJU73_08245 [Neisseria lisongii]
MKKYLLAIILPLTAYAGPAEDALLSSQSSYRSALQAHTDNDGKLVSLHTQLADAQKRLAKAQADIERLQGEIQAAQNFKNSHAAVLQQAGQQLDAAWNAVYGPGGSKAGQ